jgi:hypothetical protein
MEIEMIKGIEGLKNLFEKTLINKEKELRTILSGKPLVYLFDNHFSEYYMNERTKKEIFLKSLRFSQEDLDKSDHKNYIKYNKEARVAPKEIEIKESMVIWDDFVAIFNVEDNIGVLIHDKQHAISTKSCFDYIWSKSK